MRPNDWLRAKLVLRAIAAREGVNVSQVRQDIQNAIDEAWANPRSHKAQVRLFPKGKPTIEEFLISITAYTNSIAI